MSARRQCGAASLLLVVLAQPALPQETAIRRATIENLEDGSIETGTAIRVTGKYKELIDGDLVLYGTSVRFFLGTPELKKQVLDFVAHKDNLTLVGKTRTAGEARFVDVSEIQPASTDVEVFASEEKLLTGKGKESQKACIGVLRRVLSAYQVHADPELPQFVRRLFTLSLGKDAKALDPETTAARLEVVRETQQALGDADLAVTLAAELDLRSSDRVATGEFLRSLNARRYGGKWLSYAQFKRKEGFVEHEGRWVTSREKDFLGAIDRYRRERHSLPVLRRRTDKEYQLLAEKGVIEEGMKPEEVGISLGFPDRVERRTFEGKEFDQWVYGNKCCYFYAAALVIKPE